MHDWLDDYQRLTRGAAYAKWPRATVAMTGPDAVSVLQGLCTNDVKTLSLGDACEAFLCNVQGKIQGHLIVAKGSDGLTLDSVPGEEAAIIAGIDRYVIREDVTLRDLTAQRASWILAGEPAAAALAQWGSPAPDVNCWADWSGPAGDVVVRRCNWETPAFQISADAERASDIEAHFRSDGLQLAAPEALEALRIESGWPNFLVDFNADNLPHELGRNPHAVSFHKGCYLGQEPIARIDALGRPNWALRGLRSATPLPQPGEAVEDQGKVIARMGSQTWSPRLGQWLSFALLRRGRDVPNTTIDVGGEAAVVVEFPLSAQPS